MSAFGRAPEGANHQWRRNPPRNLSIDLVADERLGQVTGRAEASRQRSPWGPVEAAEGELLWNPFHQRDFSRSLRPSATCRDVRSMSAIGAQKGIDPPVSQTVGAGVPPLVPI